MKQSKNEINLGEGSVGRLLLTLAVPSVIAQLVNLLYNLVDRIYIGHIPENGGVALTGLGLCFPILMIVTFYPAKLRFREAAVLLLSPARSVSLLEIWSGVLPLEKRPMPLWKRISFNVRKKRTRSRHGF